MKGVHGWNGLVVWVVELICGDSLVFPLVVLCDVVMWNVSLIVMCFLMSITVTVISSTSYVCGVKSIHGLSTVSVNPGVDALDSLNGSDAVCSSSDPFHNRLLVYDGFLYNSVCSYPQDLHH